MSHIQLPPGPINPYLIEAMAGASRKSMWTAYALWYFGGMLGLHNFHLGKPVLGGPQMIGKWIGGGTVAGEAASVIGFGALGAPCSSPC